MQCLPRYADVVAVTMVDGGKYSLDLFEEGCRRVTPLNVQYKTEKETEWQATIKHSSLPQNPANWNSNSSSNVC